MRLEMTYSRLRPRFPLLYLTRVQKKAVRRYSTVSGNGERFMILLLQSRYKKCRLHSIRIYRHLTVIHLK